MLSDTDAGSETHSGPLHKCITRPLPFADDARRRDAVRGGARRCEACRSKSHKRGGRPRFTSVCNAGQAVCVRDGCWESPASDQSSSRVDNSLSAADGTLQYMPILLFRCGRCRSSFFLSLSRCCPSHFHWHFLSLSIPLPLCETAETEKTWATMVRSTWRSSSGMGRRGHPPRGRRAKSRKSVAPLIARNISPGVLTL